MRCSSFSALMASLSLPLLAASAQTAENSLEEVIVTASSRPEERSRLSSTVQVIDAEKIANSAAKSITDLLAENAVGFFSEWTPGQTSINIRGGASDGQGKDFRSQVMVLVDGRRAGTANLSKLSPADIARIEIVRGPASVVYGSQNIGGVINLITRSGLDTTGTALHATGGSWNLKQGSAQSGFSNGHWDGYLGLSAGERDDYTAGSGNTMENTAWKRWGVTGALGYAVNDNHHIEAAARMDGIYDAGFRGSGGNIYSYDNRYNKSADLSYSGKVGPVDLAVRGYAVEDVDDFRWASPVTRSSANLPAPGTAVDNNRRELDINGIRLQPRFAPWSGNELLVGADLERSRLRSTRYREGVPGNTLAQVSPQDNNQTETIRAAYFEDAQSLIDDRLVLRGGVRYTDGKTAFDPTPNLAAQLTRTEPYDATTWSLGAAFKATSFMTLRAGASTGFRAPTASELAADFNALGGGRVFGNPDLKPETSRQYEVGANLRSSAWHVDVAVFENVISDRITTQLRTDAANTSDYVNNSADIVVRGIEWQANSDLLALGSLRGNDRRHWSAYVSGAYNFDMEDKGSSATANTRNVQRMYKYQAAVGTRFGGSIGQQGWSLQVNGIFRGPIWYDTEESLLVPSAEPTRSYIHRKNPFWVWNLRAETEFNRSWSAFVNVSNLFDKNEHPIFIAIDEEPTSADLRFYNGAGGTSMPGRDLQIGVRLKF